MKHLSNNDFNDNPLVNVPDGLTPQGAVNKRQLDTKAPRNDILWFDRLLKTSGGFNVTISGGIQGVTYDGTNYYVTTATHLYKYDSTGTLVTSRSNASDGNTHKYLGDLVVRNGKLFVASANFSGPPPFSSYVVEFDASDLTYITEHLVTSGGRCDTVTFNDGFFWLPTYERTILQYDESWELVAEYPMNIGAWTYDPSANGYGFDGATWIGNNLILNVHSGVYPNCMYILYWNGTHFMRAGQPSRPQYMTQGIQYNPETNQIIAAERGPTARVSILNLRTDPPSISEWKEIGRTTLTSASSIMTVNHLVNSKFLKVVIAGIPTGGTTNAALRFNNDSGNNYARMRSRDFGVGEATVSTDSIGMTTIAAENTYIEADVLNISGHQKLVNVSATESGGSGAANAPESVEIKGKWASSSVISRVDVVNTSGTGNFAAGSEVIVYGHD